MERSQRGRAGTDVLPIPSSANAFRSEHSELPGVGSVIVADEISITETDEDLRLLFAPGSSLGGARPKASVRLRHSSLAIAKFPRRDDEINVVAWEAVAFTLAGKAGIVTPRVRLEEVAGQPVLLVTRFDRVKGRRKPFLSAMSMLGAKDASREAILNSSTGCAGMAPR